MQNVSRLLIKGMVCQRCINVIQSVLAQLGITPMNVELGEITLASRKTVFATRQIEEKLQPLGFSLVEDKKLKLVNEVKSLVADVYSGRYDFPENFRFSDLVSNQQQKDYDYVSAVFSAAENKTLERYIIDYRIGRVKEFIAYTSQTLDSIAFKLNFSSVAHLSRQFRQYTGETPSGFREKINSGIHIQLSLN